MKIMEDQPQRAAIYARVSSDQQAQTGTIASQVAALKERVAQDGLALREELCFLDEGYSGSTLIRPALERLRDLAYSGGIDRLYVHSPDRLARKYAYQALLVEELRQQRVELVFLNQALGRTPEEEMLLQMQGMIAEYERAKILERCRRGRRYAARRGSISVLSSAPYGYRYVTKHDGGGVAQYQVVLEEAKVVRQMFEWLVQERLSIRDICRRLAQQGIRTRTGLSRWSAGQVREMLTNSTYKGYAAFGKTRIGPRKPTLRPPRGYEAARQPYSRYLTAPEEQERIPVPALVSEELFEAVQEQLAENRRRKRQGPSGARHLLQGLVVCACCRYACTGRRIERTVNGKQYRYAYYRCCGADADRFGAERVCRNKPVRTDLLEQAVWEDVTALLRDPQRIAAEYERRLQGDDRDPAPGEELAKLIRKAEQSKTRLIDAYEDGLLSKEEFQPRISRAQERLKKLGAETEVLRQQQADRQELRLVIGSIEAFSRLVQEGLQTPDRPTRRNIIKALVKRVEIGPDSVRVVYRITPRPFAQSPVRGFLQDCWSRHWRGTAQQFSSD
jgi:site-specific DNA recombinase